MNRIISLLLVFFLLSVEVYAQDTGLSRVTEYQVKAAFLFNFTKFVDWPEEVFSDTTQPIIIGILGKDPFGAVLEQIIHGKTVRGRKLIIRRFKRFDDLKFCHLLFISSSEKNRLFNIFKKIEKFSVLTIGETNSFAERGGIIKLFSMNNKVRFEINVEAAEQAGLKLSSRLLKLARIVDSTNSNDKH